MTLCPKQLYCTRFPMVALGLCAMALPTGCATYRTSALSPLRPEFHHSTATVGGVSVSYEPLKPSTVRRYFNKDMVSLGYQPVQFTVINGPKRHLALEVSQINLPTVSPETVAEECHFNTAARAGTYGVLGLFIWPLLVPAVVDGVGSHSANARMDADFSAKVLKDQTIAPYGVANGVIFVPTDQMSSTVTMRLRDLNTGEYLMFRWPGGLGMKGKARLSSDKTSWQ